MQMLNEVEILFLEHINEQEKISKLVYEEKYKSITLNITKLESIGLIIEENNFLGLTERGHTVLDYDYQGDIDDERRVSDFVERIYKCTWEDCDYSSGDVDKVHDHVGNDHLKECNCCNRKCDGIEDGYCCYGRYFNESIEKWCGKCLRAAYEWLKKNPKFFNTYSE